MKYHIYLLIFSLATVNLFAQDMQENNNSQAIEIEAKEKTVVDQKLSSISVSTKNIFKHAAKGFLYDILAYSTLKAGFSLYDWLERVAFPQGPMTDLKSIGNFIAPIALLIICCGIPTLYAYEKANKHEINAVKILHAKLKDEDKIKESTDIEIIVPLVLAFIYGYTDYKLSNRLAF